MATNDIIIRRLQKEDEIPYDLLLLADPSRDCINQYITHSEIYAADLQGQTVGCYALYEVDDDTTEIKNIAVNSHCQGRGFGTTLLKDAIEKAMSKGMKKIIIGTGNSSIKQLYLYQKIGFRITDIKADFFSDNYQEPILENGIECRDQIILTKEL